MGELGDEEPEMSLLSGTSSPLLLRPGAGLVALTLGVPVVSRVLPKLPGVGGRSGELLRTSHHTYHVF